MGMLSNLEPKLQNAMKMWVRLIVNTAPYYLLFVICLVKTVRLTWSRTWFHPIVSRLLYP